jgi:RimJ/RimL family protein N-acetyltransferase
VWNVFHGKRVALRCPEFEDIPDILRHFNDIEVRLTLHSITPVSAEQEKEWIKKLTRQRRDGTDYVFAIDLQKPKRFLGICAFNKVNAIHRSAELGIFIHNKEYWNQGLGTEAIKLLLAFGFDVLNLHRIYLICYEYNYRAKRVYEKVGFKETGRQREAIKRFGQFFDLYIMDLLVDEYRLMNK